MFMGSSTRSRLPQLNFVFSLGCDPGYLGRLCADFNDEYAELLSPEVRERAYRGTVSCTKERVVKTFKLRINRGGMWTLEKLTNPIDDPRGYRSMYPATDDPEGQDRGQAMDVDLVTDPPSATVSTFAGAGTSTAPLEEAQSFTDAADRFLARMRDVTPAPVEEPAETSRAVSPEKRKTTRPSLAPSPPQHEPKESAADRYRRELKAVEEEAKQRGKALKKIIEKEEEAAKRRRERDKDKSTTASKEHKTPSKESKTPSKEKKSSSKKRKSSGKTTKKGPKHGGYSANIPSDEEDPQPSTSSARPAQRAQGEKAEPPRRVKDLISTEVCSTWSGQGQVHFITVKKNFRERRP